MRAVVLGDLVDFYNGGGPAKSKPELWQGYVPWFSAKDMKKPRLEESAEHIKGVPSSVELRWRPGECQAALTP